jgi:hypothetical protein
MTFLSLFTNLTPWHATRHTFSHPAFTSSSLSGSRLYSSVATARWMVALAKPPRNGGAGDDSDMLGCQLHRFDRCRCVSFSKS